MSERFNHSYCRQIRGPDQQLYTETFTNKFARGELPEDYYHLYAGDRLLGSVRSYQHHQKLDSVGNLPEWYAVPSMDWTHCHTSPQSTPDFANPTPAAPNQLTILAYNTDGRLLFLMQHDGFLTLPSSPVELGSYDLVLERLSYSVGIGLELCDQFEELIDIYDPAGGICHCLYRLEKQYDKIVGGMDVDWLANVLTQSCHHLGFLFLHAEDLALFIAQNRTTGAVKTIFAKLPHLHPKPRPEKQPAAA